MADEGLWEKGGGGSDDEGLAGEKNRRARSARCSRPARPTRPAPACCSLLLFVRSAEQAVPLVRSRGFWALSGPSYEVELSTHKAQAQPGAE